jgi:hypothetical protein
LGLPEYLFRHDDVLEQSDLTDERIEWLHSRDTRSSDAHIFDAIMREPARPRPMLTGYRGGNDRGIHRELSHDANDADIFREALR